MTWEEIPAEVNVRGSPQGVFVPVGLAAAQAVDARMGNHRAVLGAAGPVDGDGLVAGLVGGNGDREATRE